MLLLRLQLNPNLYPSIEDGLDDGLDDGPGIPKSRSRSDSESRSRSTMLPLHLASAWLSLLLSIQVGALIHQQVAFDNSDVCWWSLVPPDPICPVLNQRNLTEIVHNLISPYQWEGGQECVDVYCLYYNRGFAGGRGIAVITTRDSLERLERVGDLLNKYNVSVKRDQTYLPFNIGATDGNGGGIFARQPLSRGDLIMGHTPVLLVHHEFRHNIDQHTQHDFLELAIESLPAQTAALLVDELPHIPKHDRIADMLTTDAFPVDVGGEDGHHYGVFPEAAQQRHDCRPNTAFRIDPATLLLVTTAVRPIADGEELTLSRLAVSGLLSDRKDRAQLVGGPSGCQCSQCTLSVEESTESDNRLREIRWIHGQFTRDDTEDLSYGLITYLLKLYEDERLQCCMGGAYALAAVSFGLLGFGDHSSVYAHLVTEAQYVEQEGPPYWDAVVDLLYGYDIRRERSWITM
ncbi:hypothetical protein VMCG_04086 [Cytospora schulzeri]|uniref:SET domain-containing protein n=1 Tax=Cytospora schulzeri TaxID=448051 RepID=A0A423WUD8_9PEZI|nr:hypothetical protein VMCG_04086 [Valsa malicola]